MTQLILVTHSRPARQFATFGTPPYSKPSIAHPVLGVSSSNSGNHSLEIELDSTQLNNVPLDVVVNYQLFQAPRESYPKPVQSNAMLILDGNASLSFTNLLENTTYQLQMQYYNPYYPQIASSTSFSATTSNYNTISLHHLGPQNQDRDNYLQLQLYLSHQPQDISIQLQDIQHPQQPPTTSINLGGKPANQWSIIQLEQIPFGLYQLVITSASGSGVSNEMTATKYDRGTTNTNIIPGNFGTSKMVMISYGEVKMESPFTNSSGNVSDLGEQKKVRAARRAAFLSTSGSFTLSSGGGGGVGNS